MAKGPLVDYEAARRNALYAAAWMFLKFGYTDTSLRGVAKEAGISLSALLRTFGSKEGLLCALPEPAAHRGAGKRADRKLDGCGDISAEWLHRR